MTPEEVFAKLRDIHLPEVASSGGALIDWRPLVGFVVLVFTVWLARNATQRLRTARALRAISAGLDLPDQRDRIVRLVRGRRSSSDDPPPPALYVPGATLTNQDLAELRRWADQRLR